MAAYNPKNIKLGLIGGGGVAASGEKLIILSGPDGVTTPPALIPIIRNKEASKVVPFFTAALLRPADSVLPAEELDNIQLDLETLLSTVSLRYHVLKSDCENVDRTERRSKQIGDLKPASPAAPMASGKRRREEVNTVLRKSKPISSTLKLSKNSKNSPATPNTDDSMDAYGAAPSNGSICVLPKLLPKNDTPNKFWLSVEPYCMPITNEDLRLLDDLLEQYNGPLVPPMPELGQHYSKAWQSEDLKEAALASNLNTDSRQAKTPTVSTAAVLHKGESMVEEYVNGPLTQRLVSALIEHEKLPQNTERIKPLKLTETTPPTLNHPLAFMRNSIGIENRVKKELIHLGMIDPTDFPPHNDDDEILAEIKRTTAELTTIGAYNSSALKRLHNSAEQEIKRLETKRKLDAVDQEILELYKRTLQTKAKRKPLSSEEQQEIFRLTAEQKSLADQLERATGNCSYYE